MNWKVTILKKCLPLKIQPVITDNKITFYCPVELKGEAKADLLRTLPMTTEYDFRVEPKPGTTETLKLIAQSCGGSFFLDNLYTVLLPEDTDPRIIEDINKVLTADGYYKEWIIQTGLDQTRYSLDQARISLDTTKNNSSRNQPINGDDILNLIILLETTKDSKQFIETI